MKEEFCAVLKKLKTENLQAFTKYPLKFGRRKKISIRLQICKLVYKQNTTEKWTKGGIVPFPKKNDLGITTNNKGITLTAKSVKTRNVLLLNRIQPKIEMILGKNQNGSSTSQILTIR